MAGTAASGKSTVAAAMLGSELSSASTSFICAGSLDAGRPFRLFMCYHSCQVLLLRHEQEAYLDYVLRRKQEKGERVVFQDNVLRTHLDRGQKQRCIIGLRKESFIIFIVLILQHESWYFR